MTAVLSPPVDFNRRLFSVDEVLRLEELGFFADDEHIELISGEICRMTPIGNDHAFVCDLLTNIMMRLAMDRGVALSVQNALQLNSTTILQPDLMLTSKDRLRERRMACSTDVILAVEISGVTLQIDREKKLPQYAGAGIAEVWIVNLRENVVEAYRDPDSAAGRYRECRIAKKGESISPIAFHDFAIAVSEILP